MRVEKLVAGPKTQARKGDLQERVCLKDTKIATREHRREVEKDLEKGEEVIWNGDWKQGAPGRL